MNQRSSSIRSDEIDRIESLKAENYHLKRELSAFKTDNHKLKVKVRKLQEDLNKTQKQIYNLVDPKKSSALRKFIAENGATLFLNLRQQKEDLIKNLLDRDTQIKKLQTELQTAKLYISTERRKYWNDDRISNKTIEGSMPGSQDKMGRFKSSSLSEFNPIIKKTVSDIRPKSTLDLNKDPPHEELLQLSNNLLKIKLNAKLSGVDNIKIKPRESRQSGFTTPSENANSSFSSRDASPNTILRHHNKSPRHFSPPPLSPRRISPERTNNSPQSDIDRIEVNCETPHTEIQQLQNYFFEMLDEVGSLRSTIEQLQIDQKKTNNVLKNKEEYIEELAEEINSLKTRSFINSAKPAGKKKKVKKTSSDRNSTGSLLSDEFEKFKLENDNLQSLREYLYKGRYHGFEFNSKPEDLTSAVEAHSKARYSISPKSSRLER